MWIGQRRRYEFIDSESEDDSYVNPETTSFDEYVGETHNETDWMLKDGRRVVDVLTKKNCRISEIGLSKKQIRTNGMYNERYSV